MEEKNTVTISEEDKAKEVTTSPNHSHSSGTINEPQTSNTDRGQQQPSTPSNSDPNIGEDDEQPEKRELTRSKMALLFVLGFFAILFLCFVYAIKVNASITELKDILVAIIGALSGTLGFIVGFYYKSMKE